MSSPCGRQDADVVVSHESLRRALTWLLTPSIFAVFRGGAKIIDQQIRDLFIGATATSCNGANRQSGKKQ